LSKELYKEFTLISLLFTIVAFSTLSFIIKDFISLWISPSFAAETKNIAIVLAISCMIRGAFPIYENLFKGIGKPIYNMYIIIASSLIIVILDFILIPVLGLNGAGVAYLVSPLAGIVAIVFIWRKLLKASISEPIKIYLIPLLISYFILAISFLIKGKSTLPPSWLKIIIQAIVFLVFQVFLLFGYFKLFAPEVLLKLDDLKKRTKSIWKPI
jgi:O-antigen/teichoic acid export membrane protein